MKIFISIPAYNEEETLQETIEDIRRVMKNSVYDYKIHVQDDGSTDNTFKIAKELADFVHKNNSNSGLAFTFNEEMKNCLELGADIIVHTDADNQYCADAIPLLIQGVIDGGDLVLGSRFLMGNRYKGAFLKGVGNIIFSRLFGLFLGVHITDITTGLRACNKKTAKSIEIISSFTYTHEQIIRAAIRKLRITEIPVDCKPTRESRLFKNPLEYIAKTFIGIARVFWDVFKKTNIHKHIRKLFLYMLGGPISIVIKFSVTIFLTEILNLWYVASYAIAMLVVILLTFYYNFFITFRNKFDVKKKLILFITTTFVVFILDIGFVFLLTQLVFSNYVYSMVVSTIFFFILKFWIYNRFVFTESS
jgi:glycosyltransferase involved in cell wall biosynthesis